MYSPQLLDHFEHPRNSGVLSNPQASVQLENPVCGDVLKLTATLAGDQISEIKFQAKGCVPAIACASAMTELVHGKGTAEASAITTGDVIRHLGSLPPASSHAAQLAIDALAALLVVLRKEFLKPEAQGPEA